MLVKFEKKSYGLSYMKFWTFWGKKKLELFWQSFNAILEDVSVAETIV